MRALEFSTSRIVRPSFSRKVRRLFPAGNTRSPSTKFRNHIKRYSIRERLHKKFVIPTFVTKSEHVRTLIFSRWKALLGAAGLTHRGSTGAVELCYLSGFRNKSCDSGAQRDFHGRNLLASGLAATFNCQLYWLEQSDER